MDNKEIEDIFNIEPQTDESSVPVYEPLPQEETNVGAVNEVPVYDSIQPMQEDTIATFEPINEVPTYDNVQPVEPVVEETQPVYDNVQPVNEVPAYDNIQPMQEDTIATFEPINEVPTYDNVQPVAVEPVYDNVDTVNEETQNTTVTTKTSSDINENPNAKIAFGTNTNDENENFKITNDDIKDIRKSLKENSSLKFVLFMGILILIAIMLLPVINNI